MPLRIRCGQCHRELIIDEVFLGAHCRCQHCRCLIQVPHRPDRLAQRSGVRPAHPPLKGGRRSASAAPSGSAARKTGRGPKAVMPRLRSPVVIGSIATLAVISLAAVTWSVSGPSTVGFGERIVVADTGSAASIVTTPPAHLDSPLARFRHADPLTSYFGFGLDSGTIGFVVDGDIAMGTHIDSLAFVTNAVIGAMAPGEHRVGVVMATGQQGRTLLEVMQPSTDLVGARTALTAQLPAGRTDLAKALATTANWYADVLFLVLAKPVSDAEMAILKENAEQSLAITHVIAFGQAAEQDLSPIAAATGGQFLPVTDEMLAKQVHRVQQAQQARLLDGDAP